MHRKHTAAVRARVPAQLAKQLAHRAEALGVSQSDVVRSALAGALSLPLQQGPLGALTCDREEYAR